MITKPQWSSDESKRTRIRWTAKMENIFYTTSTIMAWVLTFIRLASRQYIPLKGQSHLLIKPVGHTHNYRSYDWLCNAAQPNPALPSADVSAMGEVNRYSVAIQIIIYDSFPKHSNWRYTSEHICHEILTPDCFFRPLSRCQVCILCSFTCTFNQYFL